MGNLTSDFYKNATDFSSIVNSSYFENNSLWQSEGYNGTAAPEGENGTTQKDDTDPIAPAEKIEKKSADEEKKKSEEGYLFGAALLGLAAVLGTGILAMLYLKLIANTGKSKEIENRIRQAQEEFRKIDLDALLAETERLGAQGKQREAVIFAYHGFEDYQAFLTRLFNRPALTAREYAQLLSNLPQYGEVKQIVDAFERTAYRDRSEYREEYELTVDVIRKMILRKKG